ncbi:MAG: PTS transporter subunit EIIC [Clostridia bacterium]|nr:PTS transporter subunit EIIC [Clostridia bacterium]
MSKTKEKKGGGLFGVLQRVGRSFMLPIALLPIAGLLLGIGSSFTNPAMISAYGLEKLLGEGTILRFILTIMSETGNIIFGNLPIIFAMGVALGMAENEKATATLSAAIAFFVMHQTISTLLRLTGGLEGEDVLEGTIASVVGIRSLEMGVFGGIIVGLGVAWLHNRFYKIRLPSVLSFFGGVRFVPIISTLAYIVVGAIMFFLWPLIQKAIFSLGDFVLESGYAGTFIYGVIERALIPFGLHHVFYLPFWQTGLGGSAVIDGVLVSGAQNIFFAELASPSTEVFSVSATRFMSGKFPLMIFGLPGAALAMYSAAKPEKRKIAGGLLLSAALTSMLTGITEPSEFTFLFVAPLLYVIHCIFAGAAYMLMHLFDVGVGMTFSGGFIDLTLFGILQGNGKTNWIWVVIVGLAYFAVYYLLFLFLIKKRNYMTPGREEESETKLYTRADYNEKKSAAVAGEIPVDVASAAAGEAGGAVSDGSFNGAVSDGMPDEEDSLPAMIVRGLGGKENIRNLDSCATRLRVTVVDPAKVNDGLLRSTGASGVIRRGDGVQIIYGPRVTVIKSEVEEYLN